MLDFESTNWSVVRAVGRNANSDSRKAMAVLCQKYWQPLYVFALNRVGKPADAEDLTQAFFERVIEKHYFEAADAERGRFRSFLLSAFQHFLSNEWKKDRAQKRGGQHQIVSMDGVAKIGMQSASSDQRTPEQLYERQWIRSLLSHVMQRLEQEYQSTGKAGQFQVLRPFIVNEGQATYGHAAEQLDISESAARMATSRLRQRYRQLLSDEIAETIAEKEQVASEIQYLFGVFDS